MVKIVISAEYEGTGGIGNFRLSDEAVDYLVSKKGWACYTNVDEVDESKPYIFQWENHYIACKVEYVIPITTDLRTHPDLVECIENLGKDASGYYSNLKVIEIPDTIDWVLKQCNGVEWIAERHKEWH